jgi:hypothetical protein
MNPKIVERQKRSVFEYILEDDNSKKMIDLIIYHSRYNHFCQEGRICCTNNNQFSSVVQKFGDCSRILIVLSRYGENQYSNIMFFPAKHLQGFQLFRLTTENYSNTLSMNWRSEGNIYVDDAITLSKEPYIIQKIPINDDPNNISTTIHITFTRSELLHYRDVSKGVLISCPKCKEMSLFKVDFSDWTYRDSLLYGHLIRKQMVSYQLLRYRYPFAILPEEIWQDILSKMMNNFLNDNSILKNHSLRVCNLCTLKDINYKSKNYYSENCDPIT